MTTKQVRFHSIEWDVDCDEEAADLPTEAVLEVALGLDTDLGLEGAGLLSDQFGWCVKAFQFEVGPECRPDRQRNRSK